MKSILNINDLNKMFKLNKFPIICNENIDIMKLKVEDVYRYDVSCITSDNKIVWKLIKREDKKLNISSNIELLQNDAAKNIVLLLESPHKDEFKYKDKDNNVIYLNKKNNEKNYEMVKNIIKVELLVPASGRTGTLIDNWIIDVLSNIELKRVCNFHILIVNPIQYQTSLCCLHGQTLKDNYKKLRDYIWNKLWNQKEIKSDFIKRIIYYNPSIIINCCTKDLQPYIDCFIEEKFQFDKKNKIRYYKTYHPSNWFIAKRRYLERIF